MLCCSSPPRCKQPGLDNCGLNARSESKSRAFGGGCGGSSGCPSRRRPPWRPLHLVQRWRAGRRSPARRRATQAPCENLHQLQLKVSGRAVRAAQEQPTDRSDRKVRDGKRVREDRDGRLKHPQHGPPPTSALPPGASSAWHEPKHGDAWHAPVHPPGRHEVSCVVTDLGDE